MAAEKSPAFQFYPKDFLTDGNVSSMSLQERGAYITLICLCWQEGTLPSAPDRLANMIGQPAHIFRKLWPALSVCFQGIADGRLVHPRLEKEREKQAEFRRRQSDKGKASGVNRRATGRQPEGNRGSTGPQPDTQPKPNSPISDLRSPIKEQKQKSSPPTTNARSKQPIYVGSRITVFDWMLENLQQLLGPHTNEFRLDVWFEELDKRVTDQKLVLPRANAWEWIQEQTTAEAKRRGLRIVGESQPTEEWGADVLEQLKREGVFD